MIFGVFIIIAIALVAWLLWPGKSPSRQRKLSILAVAIPIAVLAIVAVTVQVIYHASGNTEVADVSNVLFVVGLGLIFLEILSMGGFALAHKSDVIRGMGFGLCIAAALASVELILLEWIAVI
jgi:hypothetical protein